MTPVDDTDQEAAEREASHLFMEWCLAFALAVVVVLLVMTVA